MLTVVLGVGNPVRGDDSVGLRIAKDIRRRVAGNSDVTVTELTCGGLQLMEAMMGYDRAIVIDAMLTGEIPGSVRRFHPDDLPSTRSTNSTHDGSLEAALELARALGLRVPDTIAIWGVEAGGVATLSESLTAPVETAVPEVVRQVLRELGFGDQSETMV